MTESHVNYARRYIDSVLKMAEQTKPKGVVTAAVVASAAQAEEHLVALRAMLPEVNKGRDIERKAYLSMVVTLHAQIIGSSLLMRALYDEGHVDTCDDPSCLSCQMLELHGNKKQSSAPSVVDHRRN